MGVSIAADALEVHGARHPERMKAVWRITRLVSTLEHPDPFAAVFEHLGHEGKPFQLPLLIQRRQDLFLASDLHPFTGVQL